jgi:hypothetical protein
MPTLELPPPDFEKLRLETIYLRAEKLLRLAWEDATTHVGFRKTTRYRFDAPDGAFGVLYAAPKLPTAFAESVLRDTPRKGGTTISVPIVYSDLEGRRVVSLKSRLPAKSLKLIKLYGPGLAAARTDNRIASIDDYSITRDWAKALHDHPCNADGVVYMSRYMGSEKSVVLFDRCESKIEAGDVIPLLADPRFASLSNKFKLAITR